MKVSDIVKEKIAPMFTGDVRLVDVEYEKRNDGMHLVVYIDKSNGVMIDDCVEVSRMIDPVLDELNPTNDEKYSLDVSSYGLDKPLKFDWQFKNYTGKKVETKLYPNRSRRMQLCNRQCLVFQYCWIRVLNTCRLNNECPKGFLLLPSNPHRQGKMCLLSACKHL